MIELFNAYNPWNNDIQSQDIALKAVKHWNSEIRIYLKLPSANEDRHNAPTSAVWMHAMAYEALWHEFRDTRHHQHFK